MAEDEPGQDRSEPIPESAAAPAGESEGAQDSAPEPYSEPPAESHAESHSEPHGNDRGDPKGTLRRPAGRRLVLAGARGAVGLVGIGLAIATVSAATVLPIPVLGTGATSTVVNPVAATQQRICPGPVLRLGDDAGQEATTAISLGRADVERASTRGTPALENLAPTGNAANTPSERLVLDPAAAGEDPGLLAGSQSQYVDAPDYVGFAATDCAVPSSESWLVGGSTVTGRTTLLELNNPSKVAALVGVTVFSETGTIQAAGTDGILVPAGGQHILSLAGFAPGIASPVVKVISEGGQVTAHLQESIVRTLDPGGVDLVGTTTRPSTVTVIPGIVVADHETIEAAAGLQGYQDIQGVLRVLVPGDPGDGSTSVTVSVISEDASSPTSEATITVDTGRVADVPLGDFAAGTYTIVVTTEAPAVAAIRTSAVTLAAAASAGAEPTVAATDLAWFVGAPELRDRALVSTAPGPQPMVHLVNTGTAEAVVTLEPTSGGGAGNTVTIAAGGAVAVPVTDGRSYLLSGFDSLRASVSYQGDGRLAGFVTHPQERLAQPVTVYHQFG